MLKKEAHWIGSSHWWLAEWAKELIVTYGPFRKEEAHKYVLTKIKRGEKVALAFNEWERPVFGLLANLGWPRKEPAEKNESGQEK